MAWCLTLTARRVPGQLVQAGGAVKGKGGQKGVHTLNEWPGDSEPAPEQEMGGILAVGQPLPQVAGSATHQTQYFSLVDEEDRADEDLRATIERWWTESGLLVDLRSSQRSTKKAQCGETSLASVEPRKGERINLTVDSGAVRSCLQEHVAQEIPLKEVENPTLGTWKRAP